MHSEMTLRSILSDSEDKMEARFVRFESKIPELLMYKSKSQKVKME